MIAVAGLSNLALKHLVEELQVLKNGFVNRVQTLENGWIKVRVHTKGGGKDLIRAPNALFISEYSVPAKKNPGGYSAFLKKYLFNQRVVSVEQHGVDRIVVLEFPKHFLVVELFAKGNVVLADKEMKIVKAMRREEWKDRKLEKGVDYRFPSSRGINPLEADGGGFAGDFLKNRKTAFGACVELLNVSPAVLENVFAGLKLDKKKNASDMTGAEAKKIILEVKKAYSAKAGKVFLSKGTLYAVDVGLEKEFDSANSALNELLVRELGVKVERGPKKKKKKADGLEIKTGQIGQLERKEKKLKEKAEKIYLNYSKVSGVLAAIKKGEKNGWAAKEIKDKINSVEDIVEEVDLQRKKVILKLD